jgi:hypothetical protein
MKTTFIVSVLAIAASLALSAPTLARPNNFTCGIDPDGDICTCTGTKDCRDMRTSGMCNGSLDCTGGTCKCITGGVRMGSGPNPGISGIRNGGAVLANPAMAGGKATMPGRVSKPKSGLPILLRQK